MSNIVFDDDYYNEIMQTRKCGPYPFEKIDFRFGSMSMEEMQRLWLCHANGRSFKNFFDKKESVIATTGFGMTGIPHVGTVSQILRAIRLQRSGIPVQIVLGDLDAYNGKAVDFSYILDLIPRYKNFIKNLGFDNSPPNILRTQSEALSVLKTLYMTGKYLTDKMFEEAKEDVHSFYGKHNKIDSTMTYRIKLSLNLMVADFLDLYLDQKIQSVVVFLGIDEYKYCGLAMDVLTKIQRQERSFDNFSLAGIFSPTMKGLYGYPKMGKSFPNSGIDVGMPSDVVEYKIMNGEGEYDKPENNVVYQMISSASLYSSMEIIEAYKACESRGGEWQEIKKRYSSHLWNILSKWR